MNLHQVYFLLVRNIPRMWNGRHQSFTFVSGIVLEGESLTPNKLFLVKSNGHQTQEIDRINLNVHRCVSVGHCSNAADLHITGVIIRASSFMSSRLATFVLTILVADRCGGIRIPSRLLRRQASRRRANHRRRSERNCSNQGGWQLRPPSRSSPSRDPLIVGNRDELYPPLYVESLEPELRLEKRYSESVTVTTGARRTSKEHRRRRRWSSASRSSSSASRRTWPTRSPRFPVYRYAAKVRRRAGRARAGGR